MAKWIGNNKAYKRVIKKVQLPKVEEVPQTEKVPQENINKEEKPLDNKEALKKLLKKAKEKANGSV